MSEMVKHEGTSLASAHPPKKIVLPSWEDIKKAHQNRFPPIFRPIYHVAMQDTTVELWVSPRRLPLLLTAGAMIVPVGTDLKMVVGAAKMARDYSGDIIQYEANRVAPLPPGEAFVGTGGRYRFRYTGLAVIFDPSKRTSPGIIRQAYRNAVEKVYQLGARSVILPDISENISPQPNWITPEVAAATGEAAAVTMMEAVRACRGTVRTIKVWVYDKTNAPVFLREMKRLEQRGH